MSNLEQAITTFNYRRNEAEALLRFSVNLVIQQRLRRLEGPVEVWIVPGNRFNKTYSQTQRSIPSSNLYTAKLRPGGRIGTCRERSQQYQNPVDGTIEAISDAVPLEHLFNNAGPVFNQTTHELRKEMNTFSVQDAVDELRDEARIRTPKNVCMNGTIWPTTGWTILIKLPLELCSTPMTGIVKRRAIISTTVVRKRRTIPRSPRVSERVRVPVISRVTRKQLARTPERSTLVIGLAAGTSGRLAT